MNSWQFLPLEILENVFNYIGSEKQISEFPKVYMIFPTKDVLQCQLTCKHWKPLAQSTYYKAITLNSLQQATTLLQTRHNTNIGSLANYIYFGPNYFVKQNREISSSLIRQIACKFPNLKRMYCCCIYYCINFESINNERSSGRFSKLEAIPHNRLEDNAKQYTKTACLFQKSLRELAIYDNEPKLFEDKERLKEFLCVDTLLFKISDWSNVYIVDQYVSQCPAVRWVQIEDTSILYGIHKTELWKTEINSYTHTCSHVEQLEVSGILFDIRIYNYLMNAFPNITTFSLVFMDENIDSSAHLSTDTAFQYLHYLINIPDVNVPYIPLKNINDAMMGFYDSSNTIKKLNLSYQNNEHSFLTLCNSSKADTSAEICVYYKQDDGLLALPRTGLIEKSGNNLQSLRIDMALTFEDMDVITNSPDNPDLLSYLMQRCSNLQRVSLDCVFLYFKKSCLGEIKPNSRELVELHKSLTHPTFFSGLSYYSTYIKKLIISKCKLTEEQNNTNISIDIPNTEFDTIKYNHHNQKYHHIYVMLTTTLNNKTVYYHVIENKYDICGKKDYTTSLQNEETLSIFVRCKSIRILDINSAAIRYLVI